MTSRSDGQATRRRILNAAARHIGTHGPAKLTIDSAAEAAGLSKGAVLYHFKTKNALIEALLVNVLDAFDGATTAIIAKDGVARGGYAAAYAKASFDPRNNTPEAAAGLLAAATNNIDLLNPAADRHDAYQQKLEADGISPAIATLVRLAADGLFFARAFKLAPPSDAVTDEVLAMLLALIATNRPKER
jgi:AcrR family transcriptional regulator